MPSVWVRSIFTICSHRDPAAFWKLPPLPGAVGCPSPLSPPRGAQGHLLRWGTFSPTYKAELLGRMFTQAASFLSMMALGETGVGVSSCPRLAVGQRSLPAVGTFPCAAPDCQQQL